MSSNQADEVFQGVAMTSTNSIDSQYAELRPQLERLKEEVVFVLREGVESKGIKVHAINSRVKELSSVAGKLERIEQGGGKESSLSNIEDLVGLRVVCLFLSDIPRIGECLRACFNVLKEDNKIDGADIASFGYQSVHFVCEMLDSYAGPRYDQLKSMRFEIQVRTIAMDAWAAASHYLDYKSDVGVPIPLRKDFYALSGLFYVADTHFEMFFKEVQRSREELRQTSSSQNSFSNRSLNADTLADYLAHILPNRRRGTADDLADLLSELLASGYTTVADLHARIEHGMPAFLAYEKDHPPSSSQADDFGESTQFAEVGVARVLLEIEDEAFLKLRMARDNFSATNLEQIREYRKLLK